MRQMLFKSAISQTLILAALAAAPAHAASGDLLIKARGSYNVSAGNASVDFTLDGQPISAQPSNGIGGEASISLFLTDQIALEGSLGGGKLDLKTAQGGGVMNAGMVMPAVSMQFYPLGSEATIRPYLGVGGAYFKIYNANPGEVFTNRPTSPSMPQHNDTLRFDAKLVPVVHAGLDYAITPSAFLTVEGRYSAFDTKIHISTAQLTTSRPFALRNVSISLGAGFRF